MAPRPSGNASADRRFAYAMSAKGDGDLVTARDLAEQALEAAPDWAAGWFTLGDIHEALGDYQAALRAFLRALSLDPADELGASLHIARLNGETIAMPDAYVAGLFNDYAPRFETSLRDRLRYDTPEVLLGLLQSHAPTRRHCLDLGCGTGLVARVFGAYAARYDGVDLSAGMVREARKTGLYQDLAVGDIVSWLQHRTGAAADLAVAADVFVYIRDLAPVFAALSPHLEAGSLFAFSLQTHGGRGPLLGADMRFAHAVEDVAAELAESGFTVLSTQDASPRLDRGKPVAGCAIIARRNS